jgi:endo-beta-N-acetylglucosaminidase D
MIEMLTRTQPRETEVLRLPFDIATMTEESYTHCESFLAIASKQAADLKIYREHLDLLQRQLATWKNQTTEQLERLLELSTLPEESMCSRCP